MQQDEDGDTGVCKACPRTAPRGAAQMTSLSHHVVWQVALRHTQPWDPHPLAGLTGSPSPFPLGHGLKIYLKLGRESLEFLSPLVKEQAVATSLLFLNLLGFPS